MSTESSKAQRDPVNLGNLTTVTAESHGNKKALANQVNRTASKRNRRSFFGSTKVRVPSEGSKGHTQEWPNAIGFKYHEDVTSPVQLQIRGEFPDYVRGTLYRIGPGGHEVETDTEGTYSIDHWFDGLSQIHRFQIVDPKTITYNSRHTCDSLIEQYRREGGIGKLYSFAQGRDPCKSVFSKFMSVFKTSGAVPIAEKNPSAMNIGVTVSTDFPGLPSTSPSGGINNLYAKTDSTGLQELHPETLEPIGLVDQTYLHHLLKGPLSAAHAKTDPETGDVYNFNLEFASETVYHVFKVWNGSGKAILLATIRDAPAAYLHSFFLSKKYVILCVWNSHFAYRGAAILWKKNIMDAIAPYDGNKKARFYVIDRTGNTDGVVGVYESDAFFAFHTINAWEETRVDGRGDDVICEVTTFDSLDILKKFYYHNLLGNPKNADDWLKHEPTMTRFKLEAVGTKVPQERVKKMAGYSCGFKIEKAVRVFSSAPEQNFELATINPDFLCRPHRYTYGLNSLGVSTLLENLIKYDSQTHTSIIWSKHGHTPGEPIFVANPHSTTGAEDDGVLLTVVLDGHKGKSYLLCLDARELKEVARAEMDSVVALGFHGKFVGARRPLVEGKGANGREWAEW